MSHISEMIQHAESGVTCTTGATASEIYNTWNTSGRGLTHDIVVLPCLEWFDAYEFYIRSKVDTTVVDDKPDLLNVAIALAGICCVIYILIGWSLS